MATSSQEGEMLQIPVAKFIGNVEDFLSGLSLQPSTPP